MNPYMLFLKLQQITTVFLNWHLIIFHETISPFPSEGKHSSSHLFNILCGIHLYLVQDYHFVNHHDRFIGVNLPYQNPNYAMSLLLQILGKKKVVAAFGLKSERCWVSQLLLPCCYHAKPETEVEHSKKQSQDVKRCQKLRALFISKSSCLQSYSQHSIWLNTQELALFHLQKKKM